MKYFLLFVLSFLAGSEAMAVTACSQYVGGCNYYLCRESLHSCGPRGYYQHFAHRYCTSYRENVLPHVNSASQDWLRGVAVCLQEKVEEMPLDKNCRDVENEAIASHTDCYNRTGFCRLRWEDKLRIMQHAWQQAFDPRVMSAFAGVEQSCGRSAQDSSSSAPVATGERTNTAPAAPSINR